MCPSIVAKKVAHDGAPYHDETHNTNKACIRQVALDKSCHPTNAPVAASVGFGAPVAAGQQLITSNMLYSAMQSAFPWYILG